MYEYRIERPKIFTEEGLAKLLRIDRRAAELSVTQEFFSYMALTRDAGSGESWTTIACVDYLVETDRLRLVAGAPRTTQEWVYELPKRRTG